MYLVIKHNGNPIVVLGNVSLKDLPDHIRKGYPDLIEEYQAGNVTGEEMEDVSRIEIGKMPMTEEMVWKAFQRDLLGTMWTLENRLRALEGKAAITREQFLDAVKARLGL